MKAKFCLEQNFNLFAIQLQYKNLQFKMESKFARAENNTYRYCVIKKNKSA